MSPMSVASSQPQAQTTDPKTQAAQALIQRTLDVQRMQSEIAQQTARQNAQLARLQQAKDQAAAAYLQAAGQGDDVYAWLGTGHTITIKRGVVSVNPPQPIVISIGAAAPAAPAPTSA